MKRSPLRRGTPLRYRSKRRQGEVDERRRVVAEVLRRDGYRCRAPEAFAALGWADPLPCGGPLDAHEIIRRSQWRAGYLVAANILTCCRLHHDWVGAHPSDAVEVGLAALSTAARPVAS